MVGVFKPAVTSLLDDNRLTDVWLEHAAESSDARGIWVVEVNVKDRR
jgi:hypothetical protein